ncbi:MAG: hypothetical protein A2Y07_10895 [Planctomycetes bacterium GWF2_50_10]|nr:MAG: hypothetical protein A2Y07_10895 [Planctomycetes bacterium GWF2_50_10]
MKAAKIAGWVFGGIIALLIVLLVVFLVAGNLLIKTGIKSGASAAMKVPVDVNNVDFRMLRGSIELEGLRVANPEGYQLPTLLEMGKMKSAVKVGSLLKDTVVLDYVVLEDVHVTIEQKGLGTNLQQILDNLPKSEDEAKTQEQKPGKKIQIKTLELTNLSVTMKLIPLPGKTGSVTIKLAPIKMENLGTDEPMTMATLSAKVLAAIATGVAKQAGDFLPGDLSGKMGETLGKTKDALTGAGKGIGEGVKGIFKRK